MSDTGQSTERLRSGLQAFASLIGLRRQYDNGRSEDLLAEPVSDSIEFTSLSPLTNSSPAGSLYAVLNEAWIRRHCETYVIEKAAALASSSSVVLINRRSDRLSGKVRDVDVFSVDIWFEQNIIACSCQCDSYLRHSATLNSRPIVCSHIAALVQYCLTSELIPKTSPGEQSAVCPITRLPLDARHALYRCDRCQLNFSQEGWLFLKEMDRGRCCGCQGRNCIHQVKIGENIDGEAPLADFAP